MSQHGFDVIVIGTGVAGQTAAEELATAGKRVAVVERREVGGTCALRGCEPKKVLFTAAEVVERAVAQAGHGPVGSLYNDWTDLIAFKRTFTDPAPGNIEEAIRSSGAEILRGTAAFVDPETLSVAGTSYTARDFVIATGSRPMPLGMAGEELVSTSEDFLAAETLGDRVVFLGGGYISFELAHIAASAGAQVTILQRGPQVLAGFDPELADMLARGYREDGIDVRVNAPVGSVERDGRGLSVVLGDGSRIACDLVVHGAGRVPDLADLNLDAGSVRHGRRGVEVDAHLRSVSNPHVWAAGDAAASGLPLTPVGIAQARVVVRNLTGDGDAIFEPKMTPSAVFSHPPLASIGLRLDEAREQGLDVKGDLIDTTSWASSRRVGARVSGARVIVENGTGRIVGAHLLGHHADEVINVFAAAMMGNLTARDLKSMLWAYPTSGSEIVYLV
jgi:glutathione reductase (NADPH)